MVVQHNLSAMNTNRQMGVVTSALQKSTEKLSSGYKINRAGDDAAGLSISEKMRSQIRGLNKASDNAQDGISLIQVAEGALNETHSILQRMNELATQAANDTNTSTDRTAIKAEIDQLTSEINRIQSTTQFNTQNLLDGKFTSKNLQVGSLKGQVIQISISNM
ncbi:flagellin N-terminal helical domain-containing protein, partial [Lachnospira eligens]|uniref:flagellin N-terminal helical domain-containing protein n=1 Tax=Lachnospira eligens TaxID=39485 RepID=UPI000FF1A658